MHARDYFPLGMAEGEAFCNRAQETTLLIDNIQHGKHTLLMAPRRYGKSSLAIRAIHQTHLPYTEVDFYMARNEKIIEMYILNSVVDLIGKALGTAEKLIASVKKYVTYLKPKLDISASIFKLELTTDNEVDPANNIKEALLLLDHLLTEKKQRAVLLMDEFQNVGIIAQGMGIEGAIRHAAQKTRYLTIIFSGSNRKLLQTMFDDNNRPLYKLCWKMTLSRISSPHYLLQLEKAAKLAWNNKLSDSICEDIFTVTERHPYYFNKLCDKLWVYFDKNPPLSQDVYTTWKLLLDEEKSDAVKEISSLSAGQKSVLFQLAQLSHIPLTSKQNMLSLDMASSSIMTAIKALEEKDIIEKIDSYYQIINPVIKYYVLK